MPETFNCNIQGYLGCLWLNLREIKNKAAYP